MPPSQSNLSSGVISIKRDTMAQYPANVMVPHARKSCIKPSARVTADNKVGKVTYYYGFSSGQKPTVKVTPSGPLVGDTGLQPYSFGMGPKCCHLRRTQDHLYLFLQHYIWWAATGRDAWVVDKTLTDEYVVSVDDNGNLTSTATKNSTSTDNSKPINDKTSGFFNARISTIPFNQIKNFVFPGAHVFSYKTASFSNFSDLVCVITYVNPTKFQPQSKAIESSDNVESEHEVMELDELPPLAAFIMELRAEELRHIVEDGFKNSSQFGENPDVQGSFTVTKVDNDDGMPDIRKHVKTKEPTNKAIFTTSTELMLNYVQRELVKPEGKFRALQASDGTDLLFAINSSGVFNVIKETVAQTQTG
ncbi:hypothetical protein FOXG_04856 [Fusarium oxysporum f. sp. lycopersici 4287]|uniref:Uncharacterized protein n=2 Tax=Fusarium oxysporum TaxID=5507 RepID=A0A0J9UQ72_FUSO4|nr:hypothetical protein FOXG_04856 [Fusarium oxysporum f. sp. lycopersici 4287]EXK38598.1 hypothetical protein FOMG_06163 [Fusarium oxysporum f. sp. melonis 26406]KNB01659.1 hypothetical protein FOXG_04856 [Fusarium oxysporum f. sp. lycopersici 4287]